jgi:hypothetical protein
MTSDDIQSPFGCRKPESSRRRIPVNSSLSSIGRITLTSTSRRVLRKEMINKLRKNISTFCWLGYFKSNRCRSLAFPRQTDSFIGDLQSIARQESSCIYSSPRTRFREHIGWSSRSWNLSPSSCLQSSYSCLWKLPIRYLAPFRSYR